MPLEFHTNVILKPTPSDPKHLVTVEWVNNQLPGLGPGPQGPAGPSGAGASIAIGAVSTGVPGSNAIVTNVGSSTAALLNFSIPRGDTGAGGGGITETQAINAVRQGQVTFDETSATFAGNDWPNTNSAGAPELGAGWSLASGSGATATYTHATGQIAPLAYPVAIANGDLYRIAWSQTPYTFYIGYFCFRNGATNTTDQQWLGRAEQGEGGISVAAINNYTHLVFVPVSSWAGTFALYRIARWSGPMNSPTLNIKTWVIRARDDGLYIGDVGGRLAAVGRTNIIIGKQAGGFIAGSNLSMNNIGIGNYTLHRATTAISNIAIGDHTLGSVTGAQSNIGIGTGTLGGLSIGNSNIAIGAYAGGCINTSHANIAIGVGAMASGGIARGENVVIGMGALNGPTGCERNTVIGTSALNWSEGASHTAAVGWVSLQNLYGNGGTAANGNSALGSQSGRYLSDGATGLEHATDSVFIGRNSRGGTVQGLSNMIVIGANAAGGASNTVTLGDNQITQIRAQVTTIAALSDRRLKEDIQLADTNRCLDTVRTLPVHRWAWSEVSGAHRDKHVTGFLSDDMEKVFPKSVTKSDEWFPRRDADGKPIMKTANVEEELLPMRDPNEHGWAERQLALETAPSIEPSEPRSRRQRHMVTREREIEDGVMLNDAARIELTEVLPTLWGAVQQIIERLDALEQHIGGSEPR